EYFLLEVCFMLYDKLQEKRVLILKQAEQNGIRSVKVFGSVARGEDGPNSDLDLLVEFDGKSNLFDLIRFKQSVEDLLHIKVDVVTEQSIHRLMKEEILNGAIQL